MTSVVDETAVAAAKRPPTSALSPSERVGDLEPHSYLRTCTAVDGGAWAEPSRGEVSEHDSRLRDIWVRHADDGSVLPHLRAGARG